MYQWYCCFRKHRYTVFSRIVAFPSIYLFICLLFIYLFIFKKRGFYLLFFHLNHDFYLRAASVRENTVFFNVWIRRKLSKIVTCAEEFVPYCQIRVIKPHGKNRKSWKVYNCGVIVVVCDRSCAQTTRFFVFCSIWFTRTLMF